MPYINQLLSNYKSAGATTVEQVKKLPAPSNYEKERKPNFKQHEYTAEELHSIVTSIDSLSDTDL